MGTAAVILLAALATAATGVSDAVSYVNFPAVVVLSTAGVTGLFFIVRMITKYTREFTNVYVVENHKLRARIDDLEAECVGKDAEISELRREVNSRDRTISRHETTIERHEETIDWKNRTITRLEGRLREMNGQLDL